MDARWHGPASGVGAVVLIFGSFVAAGSAPKPDAPIQEVLSFYSEHDTGQLAGASLLSLGALLFLVFAATLARLLRSAAGEHSAWPTVCICGGVLLAAGLLIFAGVIIALGDVAVRDLEPGAAQALHVLNQELFFPLTIGASAFMLGAGFAALGTGVLPGWAGWTAVALGVLSAVPSHVFGGVLDHVGFGAFLGLGVWTLAVSVLLARLSRSTTRQQPPHPQRP